MVGGPGRTDRFAARHVACRRGGRRREPAGARDGPPGRRAPKRATSPPFRALALLAGAHLFLALPLAAQTSVPAEMLVLGANVLLGGATSGLVALVGGAPVLPAAGRGAAGGTLVYAGKRIASTYALPGSGLLGRALAATGASVVRNGAASHGPLGLMVLPLGPLTVYFRPDGDSINAPVKLHLARAAFLAAMLLDDDAEIDWRETLHAGAPVFRKPGRILGMFGDRAMSGFSVCGAIVLSDLALLPGLEHKRLVAHERVHVLQDHFVEIAWTGPAESWLLGLVPGGRWVRRYVDVGAVHLASVAAGVAALPHDERPWEMEAEHFEGGP